MAAMRKMTPTQPLETLIYISTAVVEMEATDLDAILKSARRNNAKAGVTGALLYAEGGFIQVLEGSPSAVRATFARIEKDRRHHAVTTLFQEAIEARAFSDWDMGFLDASDGVRNQFKLSARAVEAHMSSIARDEVRTLLNRFCANAYPHQIA